MNEAQKPLFTNKIFLLVIFGLVAFVLYFYFFVGTTDVINVIGRINFFYYAVAFVAFLTAVFLSYRTWYSLLKSLSVKTTFRNALLVMWVGLFYDATVPEPGWSGDLSKAYMLGRASDQDSGRIVASVVGQKIIGMLITVGTIFLGLILLAWNYTLPSSVIIFIAIALLISISALIIVYYVSTKPKATKTLLNWLIRFVSFIRAGRWDSRTFRLNTEEMLNRFHEGIQQLRNNPKALVRPVAFSLLSVAFDVSVVFLTFAALRAPIPVDKVLIVYALTGTLQSIGVSVIGFTEIIMSTSYTILGIPSGLSLSATLLSRVITLWFKLIVSYVAFQWACVQILRCEKQRRTQ